MSVEPPLMRDVINGVLNSRIPFSQFGAAFQGTSLTDAELAAGVTPTNYGYPPGDVRRYGAVGDGVTDDAPAFNQAVLAAKFDQGATIVIGRPPVQYLLMSPWNLTDGSAGANSVNLVIRGEGSPHYGNNASAAILIKHTGHAVDMTGAISVHWYDVSFATDSSIYPDVGFFLSRCSASNSSQFHRFTNVTFFGKCSIAIRYNYGSEDIIDVGCSFYNTATDANRAVCITDAANSLSLTSTFVTVSTPPRSTIDHKIFGGEYALMSSTNGSGADVFRFNGTVNAFRSRDIWVKGTGCRSIFHFDPANGPQNNFVVDGMWIEDSATLPQYGLYFPNASGSTTFQNISVLNSRLATSVRAIYAGTNVVLDNLTYLGVTESASLGIESLHIVQNSNIFNPNLLTLANSNDNFITGYAENWTVTTRSNDNWSDFTSTVSWSPAFSTNITVTGALTTSEATYHYDGKYLEVKFRAFAATSITGVATGTITGLPRACKAGDTTALVLVTNQDTGALLAGGFVSGSTIRTGAFTVGANVTAQFYARYRVA